MTAHSNSHKQSTSTRQPSVTQTPEEPATKGERTRAALLDASYKLFISQGYHGTSMRDIADAAGLALGGIYNHFATKEDIYVATLVAHHPFLKVLPALQAAQGDTVEALVCDAAARMRKRSRKRPEFLNLIFIEFVEFEGKHMPQLFQILFPQLMEFGRRLEQAEGSLRGLPPAVIVRAFIGLIFSYFMTEMLFGNLLQPDQDQNAFDDFVEIYLHGVLAEG